MQSWQLPFLFQLWMTRLLFQSGMLPDYHTAVIDHMQPTDHGHTSSSEQLHTDFTITTCLSTTYLTKRGWGFINDSLLLIQHLGAACSKGPCTTAQSTCPLNFCWPIRHKATLCCSNSSHLRAELLQGSVSRQEVIHIEIAFNSLRNSWHTSSCLFSGEI